jgi:class 3 adenylate cyclase/tetratricopeptide (TPR) repeat protein
MKCPNCHVDQEETQKFCRMCGTKLQLTCRGCGASVLPEDRFCGECRLELKEKEALKKPGKRFASGRKHITALFADLSGYTPLTERLDPEEVKDLMSHIFAEISKVILQYEGFIDKFVGDAVMALFGIPWSHEDDPVRAIQAAIKIHQAVGALSPKVQEKIGQPLSMHIGVSTGLVVTEEIALADGTHHVAGETINVASRLCSLAKGGETLAGHTTYAQTEGFFSFERLEPVQLKGITKPVAVYKVLCPKESPCKTHRISGRRAVLIGRQSEMANLAEAVDNLLAGKGSVISLCGEAGTGKSRLIEEFKSTLDLAAIQWLEGRAYAYAQNIPYYPFIDLLNRTFHISEGDPPEIAKEKAETSIRSYVGDTPEVRTSLEAILSISPLEMGDINPDAWKTSLYSAFDTFFAAAVRRAPTIICLEDLHWADPSSLELLHYLLTNIVYPAIYLCVFRDQLDVFSKHRVKEMGMPYREIRLEALSPSETALLVGSLLGNGTAPLPLQRIIQEKVGGNPFYVEEVINSFIESGILVPHDVEWSFKGNLQEIMVPPTIQGIIAARVDLLDDATKLVLQEASVIGREFYQEVLENITAVEGPISPYLQKLEALDLIRVGTIQPDVEYYFKHALIQEAVYHGLLRKQRKDIHERVGLALEAFFQERSLELWETLAFHFKRGLSLRKAVDYLVKSGEKSLRRHALEEANLYYREAFDRLSPNPARSKDEDLLLIDLLMDWCMVFYYLGRFEGMTNLLLSHLDIAKSLQDKAKTGAYYFWLGHAAFWQGARLEDSYHYLQQALALGEETGNRQLIGSACSFLIKTCAEMGYLKEAIEFEKRTEEHRELFAADIFFHFTYYTGKGYLGWFLGDRARIYEAGKVLLDFGEKVSSLRCRMLGNMLMGFRHYLDMDMVRAIDYQQKVIAQGDPYHAMFARLLVGLFLVHVGEFAKAEEHLTLVIEYSEKEQNEYLKTAANLFLGAALAARGDLVKGIRLVEEASKDFLEHQRKIFYSLSESILGTIYLQVYQGAGDKRFSFLVRNLGFLLKNVPSAGKNAERHLTNAIQVARQTGAQGFLGQPCLQLGLLYKLKGQKEKAKEFLEEATRAFEDCQSAASLHRAQELLQSMA